MNKQVRFDIKQGLRQMLKETASSQRSLELKKQGSSQEEQKSKEEAAMERNQRVNKYLSKGFKESQKQR